MTYRDSVRTLFQQLEMAARSAAEMELFVSDPNTVSLSDPDMLKLKVCIGFYIELKYGY